MILTLDTTAYSALDKGDMLVKEQVANARSLLLPVVVMAELRFGFSLGSRTTENIARLERFIAQEHVEVGFIDSYKLAEIYAELQLYARQHARALSNNDIWITALAQETNSHLITHDNDFAVFKPLIGERLLLMQTL